MRVRLQVIAEQTELVVGEHQIIALIVVKIVRVTIFVALQHQLQHLDQHVMVQDNMDHVHQMVQQHLHQTQMGIILVVVDAGDG